MDQLNIREIISMARRRKTPYFLTFAAVFLLAVSFAVFWPPKYRSVGTIQIQQPDIPQDAVSSAGNNAADAIAAFADLRIQQIHDKITATQNIVDLITKFDLYADLRSKAPMSAAAQMMQNNIKLLLRSADFANPSAASHLTSSQLSAISFTISFDYSDPLVTQQVTNELMTRFLDEDLRIRREQAKSTSAFLADQIKTLEASLSEQERKISDFQAKHAGARPADLAFNMQMEATTSQTLQNIGLQLAGLDAQKGNLDSQLAGIQPYSTMTADGSVLTTPAIQLKALQARYSIVAGQYGPNHPDVVKLRKQIDSLQSQLGIAPDSANIHSQVDDLRARLAELQKNYGPDYPETVSLQRKLKALVATEQSRTATPTLRQGVKDADNPAYLVLQSQLSALEVQRRSLLAQQENSSQQHVLYTKRVAEAPSVEQEFASLSRDYDNAQLRYRELKDRKLSADMNEQLEQGRKGERLMIMESPDLPNSPRLPPRKLAIAGGFVMAVFSGIAVAYVVELMSQAVYGTRRLAAIVGVPPLVAIPYIPNRADRNTQVWWRVGLCVVAVLAVAVALLSFDAYVMPLDVLWTLIMRSVGLS